MGVLRGCTYNCKMWSLRHRVNEWVVLKQSRTYKSCVDTLFSWWFWGGLAGGVGTSCHAMQFVSA